VIGLLIGTVVWILAALIYGRFKGKTGELTMAAMGIPVFTYLASVGVYGEWNSIGGFVFFSTPLGDFAPNQLIGLETFLATFVAFTYVWFRSKGPLTIDELAGTSLSVDYTLVAGAGLAASGGLLPFLLSLALVAGFGFLSHRNPLRALKAAPCGESMKDVLKSRELDCLTDDVSYNVYRSGNTLVVGGKFVKEFPRWREVADCMADFPGSGRGNKVFGYGTLFLLIAIGFVLPIRVFTVLTLYSLAFVFMFINAVYMVKRTKVILREDCQEVMEEYVEFYRKKTKERNKRAVVID